MLQHDQKNGQRFFRRIMLKQWPREPTLGLEHQGSTTMVRPRRSLLFMPGSNARALEKAPNLPADGIILDLEDSVAPDAKAMARDQIAEAIAKGGFGKREVLIRINALDSPWVDRRRHH